MAWKGFVKESQSYLNYGKSYSKCKFWLLLPLAYIRYKITMYKEKMKGINNSKLK